MSIEREAIMNGANWTQALEDEKREDFVVEAQSDEFYDFLVEHYLTYEETYKLKIDPWVEDLADGVFDWLLERDLEFALRDPVGAAYYYRHDFQQ